MLTETHCIYPVITVQRGVDHYGVQRLVGDKDGRITQRYAHLAAENLQDAILRLDERGPDKKLAQILRIRLMETKGGADGK